MNNKDVLNKVYLTGEGLEHFWNQLKNNFLDVYKQKLDTIAEGAEVNVQADWSETESDKDGFIKNKPEIYTKQEINNLLASAFQYKGVKATVNDLPVNGNKKGDVWHIAADGSEHAWDGETWQELGTIIDLSIYPTKTDVSTSIATVNSRIDNVVHKVNNKAIDDDDTKNVTLYASDITLDDTINSPTILAALNNKQNTLTAGNYISISSDGEISLTVRDANVLSY